MWKLWAVVPQGPKGSDPRFTLQNDVNAAMVKAWPIPSFCNTLAAKPSCSAEPSASKTWKRNGNGARVDSDLEAMVILIVQLKRRHWRGHLGRILRRLEASQTNTTRNSIRAPSLRRCRPDGDVCVGSLTKQCCVRCTPCRPLWKWCSVLSM